MALAPSPKVKWPLAHVPAGRVNEPPPTTIPGLPSKYRRSSSEASTVIARSYHRAACSPDVRSPRLVASLNVLDTPP